jgi:hypothetical protein
MPYGTAPLSDADLGVLATWLANGAPLPSGQTPLPPAAVMQVAQWEAFLNGDSLKERITARYLYEHWFVAHLYFDDLPAGPFFQVVRSRTPPGDPLQEIATVRPYDAPGVDRVWYRLKPIDAAIVSKTHIVYPLGAGGCSVCRRCFLDAPWEPTAFPSYDTDQASNRSSPSRRFPPAPAISTCSTTRSTSS